MILALTVLEYNVAQIESKCIRKIAATQTKDSNQNYLIFILNIDQYLKYVLTARGSSDDPSKH